MERNDIHIHEGGSARHLIDSSSEERSITNEAVKKWSVIISWLNEETNKLAKTFSWAKPISPAIAPTLWNLINGFCCLGTASFLLLGLTPSQSHSFAIAEKCYVPFNMVVCVFWLAEAALWMLFDEGDPIWQKTGELLVAAYFIIDGVYYCYEWWVLETPPEAWDIILYTTIDFGMYLWYFVSVAYPDIGTKLIELIPQNPREVFSWPFYKYAMSGIRIIVVWWIPTMVTLIWINWSLSAKRFDYAETTLFSAVRR